jgi:Na+-translocating ferredoxin:NAD+ oxidoreductase RnfE subunit
MTVWQFIGILMLLVVGAVLYIGTARTFGWKDATITWLAAMLLAGVVIVGVMLAKGALP